MNSHAKIIRTRHHKIKSKSNIEYRKLWSIVDGAVTDAIKSHPDYITEKGYESMVNSITKRVVGQVTSYLKGAQGAGPFTKGHE